MIGFEQPYEWKPERNSAREIASVLDLSLHCRQVLMHAPTFALEAAGEAVRLFAPETIRVPSPIRLISQSDESIGFFTKYIPAFREQYVRSGIAEAVQAAQSRGIEVQPLAFRSVKNLVDIAEAANSRHTAMDEWSNSAFEEAFRRSKVEVKKEKRSPRECALERLQRLDLFVDLIAGLGLRGRLDDLWSLFEIDRCPALDLWSRIWWRYVSGKAELKKGDLVDISLLPAYCYSEFSLTERSMCHFLREAHPVLTDRVFSTSSELVRALGL